MSILHILHDGNFIEPAINLFEKHYPGENIYLLDAKRERSKFSSRPEIEFVPNILTSSIKQKELVSRIVAENIHSIVFHCLSKRKATLAYNLKLKTNVSTYWIFFGVELYDLLYQLGRYDLFDSELSSWKKMWKYYYANFTSLIRFGESRTKSILKGMASIDYFCCWNENDYQLLKKNFPVKCLLKHFFYYSLYGPVSLPLHSLSGSRKVMINHSGSLDGNHLTVLEKLKKIDSNKDIEVLIPLSYGNLEYVNNIKSVCLDFFGSKAKLITDFLPRDEYFEMLKAYPVAIFGHRRQEAAGNIFRLLAAGFKIFLREDNNMLKWLRGRGFFVYSFEEDFNGLDDIEPLPYHQVLSNNRIYNLIFSSKEENVTMSNLI